MRDPAPGRVYQVNRSAGGVPKTAVAEAFVTELGIVGDLHRNTRTHGGPERALCLYSLELIQGLQAEGHRVEPGSLGENLTLEGIDLAALAPGDRLRVGEVLIELTRHTTPCANIAPFFQDEEIERVAQPRNPGWSRFYARVLEGGTIRPGDPVERLTA